MKLCVAVFKSGERRKALIYNKRVNQNPNGVQVCFDSATNLDIVMSSITILVMLGMTYNQ